MGGYPYYEPGMTVMIKVKGKRFICPCGSNVFHYANDSGKDYVCNGCHEHYTSRK
jgi:hypothetical protein